MPAPDRAAPAGRGAAEHEPQPPPLLGPEAGAGEAGFLADLEDGVALGAWPWYPQQRRRREEAEARERDREAALYADWVAFRTARGIPDAGEGELPEDWPGGRT